MPHKTQYLLEISFILLMLPFFIRINNTANPPTHDVIEPVTKTGILSDRSLLMVGTKAHIISDKMPDTNEFSYFLSIIRSINVI